MCKIFVKCQSRIDARLILLEQDRLFCAVCLRMSGKYKAKKDPAMKEKWMRLRINKKYIHSQYIVPVILTALLLFGIMGATLMNTKGLYHQIGENTTHYADDVSAQLASNISSRMQMRHVYIRNLADTLSEMPEQVWTEQVLTEELLDRKAAYMKMDEIYVVNADGTTFPGDETHAALGAVLAAEEALFTHASVFLSDRGNVCYSAPILRDSGRNSLLIGVRTQTALQQMLRDVNFREQGLCCIVDSQGKVIVSSTDNAPFEELMDIFQSGGSSVDSEEAQQLLEDIQARRSGTAQFDSIGNEPVMLGYDFLGINDWILLTLVSSDLFSRGTEKFMV